MTEPSTARSGVTPWDRPEPPSAFSLEESARRAGHYAWTERRLFEVLGGWVAGVPELDVKLRLGTFSYHHAWHAELWQDRLPRLREMDAEARCVAPNGDWAVFLDAVGAPQAPELTVEKLVGVYRVVVPHLIAVYTFHRSQISSVADAPTMRALQLILDDAVADWWDGEMLLRSLVDSPAAIDRATSRQGELEKLLLASGGVCGLGSIALSSIENP